ncbi:ATP-dependent RNA helicase SrmB [Ferrimonas balearica]|uniref:ATP-dependent RNA helicase SrmB n=1 Tax=Ferrimonas balearica TaxID=44012 RepID=UPI001C94A2BC|nr:ATP-dependent RNA helicase SrmB [Ferrimonas balearica]MBY6107161.1 ATP-dependent RNA helicase SrmB [Ferrimonas balearica]MBY6224283.1 ATP-dependent RNA helicase SrmB [Ferrimonas balearica]
MSFADFDLDPRLEKALAKSGYTKPTTIQRAVLEAALEERDILASAPTGTGKTAAYLLPALQHLLDFPRREAGHARVLVLTPTRELAQQVEAYGRKLLAGTQLSIGAIVGGKDYQHDADLLKQNMDILVATPGRLIMYLEDEKFDPRQVEIMVIDEADRMLDMGFMPVVDRIAAETRWRKQTMLFSATLEGAGLDNFVRELLNDPVHCDAKPPRSERKKITQYYYRADDMDHKFKLLKRLLADPECTRAMIFTKTRDRATELHAKLFAAKIRTAVLQGAMVQGKRDDALERFREGRVQVLVATDVAARGIDIANVTHVINFDLPRTSEVYLHRIGRTARAGAKGMALNLVEAHDMPMLDRIQRYIDEPIKVRVIESLRPRSKAPSFSKPKKKTDAKGKKKSATKGKKKASGKSADKPEEKKQRHRDRKNIGKRRAPAASKAGDNE